MLNLLNFGTAAEIQIELDNDGRQHTVKGQYQQDRVPIYSDGDSLTGSVVIGIKREGKLEHQGIRIELCGITELFADRGSQDEFLCITQDLARPGILSQKTTYPFEFLNVPLAFESYHGTHVHLKYFLRVIVNRRWGQLTKDCPLIVHCSTPYSSIVDGGDKMEVGIEESLHVEIEYNKQKFEIMDGAPVRGEWIPIRLFLGNYPLSPSVRDVNRKFSVRYYLNLVIIDDEERRYYKQQEILLYRGQYLPDGICQSCTGDKGGRAKSLASVKPQASDNQTLNKKLATEVHSGTNSGRVESRPTSDETDRSGDCRSRRESADEVSAGAAMEEDVFASAEGKEAQQDEQARQTSDSDLSAAVNTIFIGDDNREAVAALQNSPTGNTEAENSNNSDIDETVLEEVNENH